VKLAINQPYFFPYLDYFGLLKQADQFIALDVVQFTRHGWVERNRILKQTGGWQYVKVPLIKHSHLSLINEIFINNDINWRRIIFSQIEHYRKTAPYYNAVKELLVRIFDNHYMDIVQLNVCALKETCAYLGIQTPIEIFSQMDIKIEEVTAPDEWALNICNALGDVDTYYNLSGGVSFFDRTKYARSHIQIYFRQINGTSYNQKRSGFEPSLSILDVMMFNSPEEIINMLDDCTYV
jgi:hypothetical protein